jgi:hypothetical protein
VAGKKKDFSELHKAIINELTGVERARSELHAALVTSSAKFKALTLGQLSTQLKALTDEGKLVMSGERRTAKYTVAKSKTVKPAKSK